MTDRSFYFNWGKTSILTLEGPDAKEFLHRLSTVNFKKDFSTLHGAFLNGQAKFISIFTAWMERDKICFFIEPSGFEKTWEYLNKMHFGENLKIKKTEKNVIEKRSFEEAPIEEKAISAFNYGIPGQYLLDSQKEFPLFLSPEEFDFLRASQAFPKPHIDITEDNILIEGPFEKLIDRDKGCYPGQEVIEKIYTYGRTAQKIFKIEFSKMPEELFLPADLVNEKGEKVGTLTSAYQMESGLFGIGTVKRFHYDKTKECYITAEKNGILGTIV